MDEDLIQKLAVYSDSFQKIQEALKADPENEQLLKLKREVQDALKTTEELIKKKDSDVEVQGALERPPEPPQEAKEGEWKAGMACLAQYSADSLWYEAVIEGSTPGGNYQVVYTGYGNKEERPAKFIRARDAPIESKKRGPPPPPAPKDPSRIPKNLEIKPTDSPEEREVKRKKLKSLHKAENLKKKHDEKEQRANSWQKFATKSLPKKESIFKTPDNATGKVGVVGSGKPMTTFIENRPKWDKLKDPEAFGGQPNSDD